MPEGAVYVGRPSVWGNDFTSNDWGSAADKFRHDVAKFQVFHPDDFERWIALLRGKDLACWCPLDAECHADVLLELAAEDPSDG